MRLERNPDGRGTRQVGFTMIELLVVVGIIAIGAALTFPMISQFLRNYAIKAAAQQVAGEIQAARGRAIARNTNFGVVFIPGYPTANQYQFVSQDAVPPSGTMGQPQQIPPPATPVEGPPNGYIKVLPEGVVFVAAAACPGSATCGRGVRFSRLGTACPTGQTGATGTCPDPPAPPAGAINFNLVPATNVLELTLRHTQTGLGTRITITPGGRVRILDTWVP